mgnify:CR=1 FL=1
MEQDELQQLDVEGTAMEVIAHAGECRTLSFEALACAKKGEMQKAEELLKQAEKESIAAHQAQTEFLFAEGRGEKIPFSVLITHAQDHYMTAVLAFELIREMIGMIKNNRGN